jgi:mono/diheme cytochrome c family protein
LTGPERRCDGATVRGCDGASDGARVRRCAYGAACAVLLGSLLSVVVRSDEPISSSVTYNREVYRIFESRCLACHAGDGVAMPLGSYREARPWARAVREELIEGRMPPWDAAPGYAAFANDIGLSARELATILTWTDGGTPRGDDRDLPARAGGHRHAAHVDGDARLDLPPQQVPAGEEHIIRRVTIDPGAAAGRWVRRIDVVPGDTRVLRAAFVFVVPGEARGAAAWVSAWTPWLRSTPPPEDAAFRLPAGARLLVELHYRGRDARLEDRSTLALFLAPEGRPSASQLVVNTAPIPGTNGDVRRRGESTVREDARVWAIFPHAPASLDAATLDPYADPAGAPSLEVTARRPDGSVEVLLWVPRQRHDWPTPYVLRTPVNLPAGTTVVVTSTTPRGAADGAPPSTTVTLNLYKAT